MFLACQLPSLPPRNTDPLNTLPPSFGIMFMRIAPACTSAGCAAVVTVTSCTTESFTYVHTMFDSWLLVLMPSTASCACAPLTPWPRGAVCSICRDPPMSGVANRMPGSMLLTENTCLVVGSTSSISRVTTSVLDACVTSTIGAWPETVIVSASEPSFMSALIVATKFDGSSTSGRTMVEKPVSVNVTRYTPGRRSTMV